MKKRSRILRRLMILALIAGVLAAIFLTWSFFASSSFKGVYEEYALAEDRYIVAANKPAAEANPIRRQVYLLLAQVLQVEMSNEARIDLAKQGIAHLNDLEGQIDAIKTEADTVIPLVDKMEKAAGSPGNALHRSDTNELVRLAKRQIEIISDIRGLSYRADYYTSEVFERIIDEQGAMTDEHKRYLNELIPQLEEQFDKRTNLYSELKSNDERMKEIAHSLGFSAD